MMIHGSTVLEIYISALDNRIIRTGPDLASLVSLSIPPHGRTQKRIKSIIQHGKLVTMKNKSIKRGLSNFWLSFFTGLEMLRDCVFITMRFEIL